MPTTSTKGSTTSFPCPQSLSNLCYKSDTQSLFNTTFLHYELFSWADELWWSTNNMWETNIRPGYTSKEFWSLTLCWHSKALQVPLGIWKSFSNEYWHMTPNSYKLFAKGQLLILFVCFSQDQVLADKQFEVVSSRLVVLLLSATSYLITSALLGPSSAENWQEDKSQLWQRTASMFPLN